MGSDNVDIYELGPNGPILFWLVQSEEYDKAQALLNAGADINVRGAFAMTPAIWAATSDDWNGVLFLIQNGADLTLYGTNGVTVAYLAESSRLKLDSERGQKLQKVRDILKQRGLFDNIATPRQLKDQMAAKDIPTPQGFNHNNWPPRR